MSPTLQQVDRTFVLHRGRRLSYFGGCDYFRLASHPRVLKAVNEGLKRYGLSVSASRLTTGNHRLYEELETRLAKFFGVEAATLAANGYAPNLMVAQTMAGQFSHALVDSHAHGCLLDAAQLLDCPVLTFEHRDPDDLRRIVQRLGTIRPIILTEGMFAFDGSVAPLGNYLKALPTSGMILVDDAHGAGVIGKTGRGTPEAEGINRKQIIQTITLSKAFGVYGGAVLGSRALKAAIISKSRLFVGSTPLPLPLAHAALESLAILKNDLKVRERLARNASYIKDRLGDHQTITAHPGLNPIFPVIPKNPNEAEQLKRRLLSLGIHPPFIKYPGGPDAGYFRFAISSEHTRAQLDALLKALL